jgi:hypothetical protein
MGGAARLAIAALPVAQRAEGESEAAAELPLRHVHALAKRDDVELERIFGAAR